MANPKTTLYVGGLDETVNESVIHACMLPFGEIKDVNIPLDQQTQLNKGFGFITFVEKDDAAEAMSNMHNSELYGRVLRVNYAQPMKIKPVWADADQYRDDAERAADEETEAAADPMAAAEQETEAAVGM